MASSRPLDATVTKVLDRQRADDSDDDDRLLAELEEDEAALDAFREQRMQQLHDEVRKAKYLKEMQHGTYEEVKDEREAMEIPTKTKYAMIHFFHPDFNRCAILDSHLKALAPKHYEARIIKINVENAPFLVTKLNVRVLPCLITFVDGKSVGRIEGFEILGNTDAFKTRTLEEVLVAYGVLTRKKLGEEEDQIRLQKEENRRIDEAEDDDWD